MNATVHAGHRAFPVYYYKRHTPPCQPAGRINFLCAFFARNAPCLPIDTGGKGGTMGLRTAPEGRWRKDAFPMLQYDLSGPWHCAIPGHEAVVTLPGTLDENGLGERDLGGKKWHPDVDTSLALYQAEHGIATRLTRRVTYEGPAVFTRTTDWAPPANQRVFLECERSRRLSLRLNGQEISQCVEGCISAPYVFEVTGLVTGRDTWELTCDNSYPGWPHDAIVFSSAATDETQTNWNGLLGYVRLRTEERVYLRGLRIYPCGNCMDVCAEVDADAPWAETLRLDCDALAAPAELGCRGGAGVTQVWLRGLALRGDVRRWDLDEGNLYTLTASLGPAARAETFGVRDFGRQDGRLTLNGRPVFLRSEANCAEFPETGHEPMTEEAWREVLLTYRSYGANTVRFHSHCPPEAAFAAADRLGMLMQPELSHWNPVDAFSSGESQAYYQGELSRILTTLANHPSFVTLSLGNELHMKEDGEAFAASLLRQAREKDATRLYATGSNNFYGQRGPSPADDFYTSSNLGDLPLRATCSGMTGWLNRAYPDLRTDYAPAVARAREAGQPVFSFEVGQYEVLPDFDELESFRGVTEPVNYRLIQEKVEASGLAGEWKRRVEATGELSLLCYRAEVEAALRTEGMSGISLLGLQDFPGQGTALVGMLNAHLRPKPFPFARPERFRAFFRDVLPLALLPRFTYESTETLQARIHLANYGRKTLRGETAWALTGEGVDLSGALPDASAPAGELSDLGELCIPLETVAHPSRLTLTLRMGGAENTYPVWVYPPVRPACPAGVHECRSLDDAALQVLAQGGTVYLSPDATEQAMPGSIQAQFSTDFWSVGTFPQQAGGMGQLIDASHPLFASFPTESHTDWQWWPMAGQRAFVLPRPMQAIITELDSYAFLRPMAQLLECRCHGGRLLLSSLGLQQLQRYPEARALQQAIYAYLSAPGKAPLQEMTVEEVRALVV